MSECRETTAKLWPEAILGPLPPNHVSTCKSIDVIVCVTYTAMKQEMQADQSRQAETAQSKVSLNRRTCGGRESGYAQ